VVLRFLLDDHATFSPKVKRFMAEASGQFRITFSGRPLNDRPAAAGFLRPMMMRCRAPAASIRA